MIPGFTHPSILCPSVNCKEKNAPFINISVTRYIYNNSCNVRVWPGGRCGAHLLIVRAMRVSIRAEECSKQFGHRAISNTLQIEQSLIICRSDCRVAAFCSNVACFFCLYQSRLTAVLWDVCLIQTQTDLTQINTFSTLVSFTAI